MYRLIFMVLAVTSSGVGVASYLANNQEAVLTAASSVKKNNNAADQAPKQVLQTAQPVRLSGVESIPLGQNGHYQGQFRLNNLTVTGLIDTGASAIAINETTARKAGIRLSDKDFKYQVTTANGKAKAARATISRVSYGRIRINDVEALILEDKGLSTVLIGMSFLNRLRGFEHKSGNLLLKR